MVDLDLLARLNFEYNIHSCWSENGFCVHQLISFAPAWVWEKALCSLAKHKFIILIVYGFLTFKRSNIYIKLSIFTFKRTFNALPIGELNGFELKDQGSRPLSAKHLILSLTTVKTQTV